MSFLHPQAKGEDDPIPLDHFFEDRVVVEIILHLLGDGDDDSDDEEEETDDTNDTSKEQVGDGKPKTIYQKLEKIKGDGATSISINWYYEEDDEDMLEAGEDYSAIINVPFKMIELEEE